MSHFDALYTNDSPLDGAFFLQFLQYFCYILKMALYYLLLFF